MVGGVGDDRVDFGCDRVGFDGDDGENGTERYVFVVPGDRVRFDGRNRL